MLNDIHSHLNVHLEVSVVQTVEKAQMPHIKLKAIRFSLGQI